jgi:hypothetical protein
VSKEESPVYTVIVTESELTLLVSSLAYMEKRQIFLSNLESNQGREKAALARLKTAAATVQLSDKLCTVGARKGTR